MAVIELTMRGPLSSTDNALVRFDGTAGWKVQNSGVTVDDSNNVAGVVGLTMSGALSGLTNLTMSGSISFTGTGVTVLAPNTIDGGDLYAITLCGGGGYGPTRGSGVAVIGNEYASIGGDLELMAGDSAVSGMIKFYVGDGAGSALLAGSIARTSMLATFNGSVVANSTLSVASTLTVGGQATATSVGIELGNYSGGTPFIDFKSSNTDYNVRIINGTSATLSFLGATGGYFFDTTVNSIYATVRNTANATLTTSTEGLTIAGNLVTSAYVANGYTPGLVWSSTDDNATKPKGGIFLRTTGSGAQMIFGMSSVYATGITNSIVFNELGGIQTTSKIQIGSTAPTLSAGSALTINTDVTTGAAGSGSLIIQGSSNKERIKIYSAGGQPVINLFAFRGTLASPTATQGGDLIAGVSGGGYGATAFSGNYYAFFQAAAENWTDSAMGTYTVFNSVPNGTTGAVARILIANDGTITFGSAFNTGVGALYAGAGTFTGLLTTVASASGGAGFRVPHGAAPSSPVNGDFWTTTSGAFIRINGVTKSFTLT